MTLKQYLQEVSSNTRGYVADGGEPDAGYLPGGDVRTLGYGQGKPEAWFHQLEYEQVEFPVADHIYGKGVKAAYKVIKKVEMTDLKDVLKDIDADIEEIEKNQKELYKDLKGAQ